VRTRVPPTWRWPVAHLSPHVHRAGCCRDFVFCAPSALTGPMVAPPRAGSTGPSRRPTPTRSRSNGRSSSATKRSIAVQAQRPDLPAARRRRPSPPARRPRNMGRRKLQRWINGTRPRERARVCAAEPSVCSRMCDLLRAVVAAHFLNQGVEMAHDAEIDPSDFAINVEWRYVAAGAPHLLGHACLTVSMLVGALCVPGLACRSCSCQKTQTFWRSSGLVLSRCLANRSRNLRKSPVLPLTPLSRVCACVC